MSTTPPPDGELRVVVADDEPLARRGLELLLATADGVRIVAQVGDGAAVVQAVGDLAPDLLLLDIEMPGLTGFDALAAIPAQQLPLVVFVTAFGHHAIRAFEASAVDYLLKPVDGERLLQAVRKARTLLRQREADQHRARLLALLAVASGRPTLTLEEALDTGPERFASAPALITLKDGTRTMRVRTTSIRWIDAAGDYASIHADERTHLVRTTFGALERRLDARTFVRVHRSTIVNAARVRQLRPLRNGECALTLDCGQTLRLSRTYRDRLAHLLGGADQPRRTRG